MQSLSNGQKQPLSHLLGSQQQFEIRMQFQAPFVMDYSCFGLNEQAKLLHDDYMTFFNQPQSPHAEVCYQKNGQAESFKFDLTKIQAASPQRYVICATLDHPTAVISQVAQGKIELVNQGQVVAVYTFKPEQFAAEKAVMFVEVYQKSGVWRLGMIGQGFNGGLKALVEHFGGEVAQESAPVTPAPVASNIDLRKKLVLDKVAHQAPQLLDLTKKSLISLEKKNLLNLKARVGLVLDRSGSMFKQYQQGDVQKVIDRVLPLALNFDDDGSFECWAFGRNTVQLDDVSMKNVRDYTNRFQSGLAQLGCRSCGQL
ncbi:TerD family protein [Vitreoscilla stercoraria]|uniref:TerD family protein n=1 Tax=Vitreoscilla stercoraria TaxID=61 RepID=A0ABY4EE14_VITST|nr:TerD family protein [Vitreoscilla stercoraria]UOO93180.1 TerD family protein [Vitreoscilla stercoraria]